MTNEEIISFLNKPETIECLKNCSDEESIIEFMKKNNIEISKDKAIALKKVLSTVEDYNTPLSEDQLDGITGGVTARKIVIGIVLGTLGVAATAGTIKFGLDVNDEIKATSIAANPTLFGKFTAAANTVSRKVQSELSNNEITDPPGPYARTVRGAANKIKNWRS